MRELADRALIALSMCSGCSSVSVWRAPEYPSVADDHIWCAEAAPWRLLPIEATFDPGRQVLRTSVEAGVCEVTGEDGVVAGGEVRWFGDGTTTEGLRVLAIEGEGRYCVECGGDQDTGDAGPLARPFEFTMDAEPCPVGDLEGVVMGLAPGAGGHGELFLPNLDEAFFEEGGLIRVTDDHTQLYGYVPLYHVPLYCENVGPTLSLQLLQPDGSESEVVEVDLPCGEVETGCATSRRPRAAWLAILGLPLLLARSWATRDVKKS